MNSGHKVKKRSIEAYMQIVWLLDTQFFERIFAIGYYQRKLAIRCNILKKQRIQQYINAP